MTFVLQYYNNKARKGGTIKRIYKTSTVILPLCWAAELPCNTLATTFWTSSTQKKILLQCHPVQTYTTHFPVDSAHK